MLNRKIRYFRQIVPQAFFSARASILEWEMHLCQCGWWTHQGDQHSVWRRWNTKHSELQRFHQSTRITATRHLIMQQRSETQRLLLNINHLLKVWSRWCIKNRNQWSKSSSKIKSAVLLGKLKSLCHVPCSELIYVSQLNLISSPCSHVFYFILTWTRHSSSGDLNLNVRRNNK